MVKNFNIKVTCCECGSDDIEVTADTDYTFDGDSDICYETGDLWVACKSCGNIELLQKSEYIKK